RCTPPIVLIFLVFYGLPRFLEWWLGIDVNGWSRSIFVILAMTLLFAASISEVFKSSYLALPKGQLEAGLSIGLSELQTFARILLPQAFRIALPNITSAVINLLKDIALAYTIGLVDLMGEGNLIISRNMGNYSLETYTAVAVIYWILALILSVVTHIVENQLETKGG
ncbi:amino acid ABC transporter permease, partial [Streptococcus equinus]|uniref:amino acid ABC transporter permease n=1 Tax=Streptococcus equinus TaxID=1335 RepID=UPI001F300BB5